MYPAIMSERRKVKVIKAATDNDTLSVEEAAMKLGIKPSVMRNYLYEGLFTTLKFKDFTLVDSEEVMSWKRDRQR
jgi:hypothetical protein